MYSIDHIFFQEEEGFFNGRKDQSLLQFHYEINFLIFFLITII